MRTIKKAVIHCADTYARMDVGADEIKKWHTDPKPHGNGWSDIGYHYVIRRNGEYENGRPLERPGAHARGHNENSIGICLVGGKGDDDKPEFNFTIRQMGTLYSMINAIKKKFGEDVEIVGHNDLDGGKTCPNFNVEF